MSIGRVSAVRITAIALLLSWSMAPPPAPAEAVTSERPLTLTLANTGDGSSEKEEDTGFRGARNDRRYAVYGETPGSSEESDNSDVSDDPEGSGPRGNDDESSSGSDSQGSNTDPLKIYIGDPALADEGEAPGNLCRVSPESDELDAGCAQVLRETCNSDATVFSYETEDGISRARCVNNDEIQQAINELQGQDQESLPAAAYTAFMDLSLEPAEVKFEPDLLGFGYKDRHTHMFADVDTQTVTEELLGQTVELRATPQEFHWDYGDGTSRTTFEPGEPLPDYDGTGQEINKTDFATETSHVYEETGVYPVTVETVYAGQFRVGDETWRDIPGTVSIASSPGEADIWTQNSRWVSGPCESADQWGCNGPVEFDPATDRPPKIYEDQYDENGRWIGPMD